jgi:uncharacterized protein (DUF1499 family)
MATIPGLLPPIIMISLLIPTATGYGFSAGAAIPLLKPCPSSPNCVSSLAEEPARRIPPFALSGTLAETLTRLESAIGAFPRAYVVLREGPYLKAEFRTLLGFVDDVEFLVDMEQGLVQARSASRSGYWDLGVNRRRMEAIRKVYLEWKDSP